MKIALVCIAKWEDDYIEEWVQYNKKIGFDEILIYQNDWTCKLNYSYLKKIDFPGVHMQMSAYNHFLSNYRKNYDWAAFFDCDEFLVLKKHQNIKEFIAEYDNNWGICVNWKFFGANGKLNKGENPNSILKQFTMTQKQPDRHIKTILNLSSPGIMVSPHNPNIPLLNTSRDFVLGPFSEPAMDDIAQLNHYHHKSFEDWLKRCERGQSDDCPTKKPEQWEEEKNDFSEIQDLNALNFMYNQIL